MLRNEIRTRNHRERQDLERLAERIIASGGFGFAYHGQSLFEAFRDLFDARFTDWQEQETMRYGAPTIEMTNEDRMHRVTQLSHCAFTHFNQHAPEKFRIALIEMIAESMGFADAICMERDGEDEDIINKARPTQTDLQQNVLWWSIQRQRRLTTQRREDGSEWTETSSKAHPATRATYEILNNVVLWAYDHVRMQELLSQAIRPMVEKYDDPDIAAHNLANEAAELIWENIDGAAQMMASTLLTFSEMLVFQSLAQQHNADHPEEPVQVAKTISASRLKKIASPFFDLWFEAMSVDLNKRGRPTRSASPEKLGEDRAKFIQDVKAAIQQLKTPDKGNIGLKLGYGKSREKGQFNKEAAAKALREKAKRLGVDVDALIREQKDRT